MKKMIVFISLLVAPLFASADIESQIQVQQLPEQTTVLQTVSLDVQARGDQYYNYNFGQTQVGMRRWADFVITANGPFPVQIRGMQVWGAYFGGSTNCPYTLYPGQRCFVRADYWPSRDGRHFGELNVYVGDSRVNVRLTGFAWRR